MSATVTPVRFGSIIRVPNTDNVAEPQMVMHACGGDQFPAYYDDSCDLKFANLGNLMIHLEAHGEGEHKIAAFCKTHRWFEEVPAEQFEELKKVGMVAA